MRVLDLLDASDVRFVVLHNEELLGTPVLNSDVDIAVDRGANEVLQILKPGLTRHDIVAALVWPYDVGGGASCFFARADGSGGAQLDMVYDPHGRGRYGLRSSEIIAEGIKGARYPVPEPLDRLLYELVKSQLKGEFEQVGIDLGKIEASFLKSTAQARAKRLFSPATATLIRGLLDHRGARQIVRPTRWIRSVSRILKRLRRPIGSWIEIVGPPTQAEVLGKQLEARLAPWLVTAGYGPRPRGSQLIFWWLTRVLPIRWRAGIFVSWTARAPRLLRPDLALPIADIDFLTRTAIAEMAQRAVS